MHSTNSSGNTFNFTNARHNRVAVGNNNIQLDNVHGQNLIIGGYQHTQQVGRSPVADSDLAVLQRIFAGLRAQIAAEAPNDKKTAALERIDELEDAIETGHPELSTFEYVRNWFVKYMPTFAGAVTSIVVHPIVGKIVEATGDLMASELRDRFGEGQ